MKRVLAAFAGNPVFANVILLLIFLAGGLAARFMIREYMPNMASDFIRVNIAYPGADPQEVEEGVCRKMEEAIQGMPGIKSYRTSAADERAAAFIEVKEGYDPEQVLDRVRSRINAISNFPAEAEKPVITRPEHEDVVMILYLQGDMPEIRLKEWANRIKDELRRDLGVSIIEIAGTRSYEINIEVSEEKLRQFGLTLTQAAEAVRKSNLNLQGGIIRSRGEEIRVRTVGRKYTAKELASIVILAGPKGEIVTLDRVADIRDGFVEGAIKTEIDGKPALIMSLYKTPSEDALVISDKVQQYVRHKQQVLPQGAVLDVFYDNTESTRASIDILIKNGLIGLLIVFALLWLFLNTRVAFWVGMGVPISLLGGMAMIWALGGSINTVSLFGLIMVLGLAADDAIVVGEAIYVQQSKGLPPIKAAVEGVSEVGLPVLAAIVTTVIAFLPLAFIKGMMGKFIAILPMVVICCLFISLVESMVMLPAHLAHRSGLSLSSFMTAGRRLQLLTARGLEWFAGRIYLPILRKALTWRYVSICCAVSLLLVTVGLLQSGRLKFDVFPDMDSFVISSAVEFPNGTPASVTEKAVMEINAALERVAARTETKSGEPLVKKVITMVGSTPDDDVGELETSISAPHTGGVQAFLLDPEERGVHTKDILVEWEKEVRSVYGARALTFFSMSMGPTGDPIRIRIQGTNLDEITTASEQLIDRLKRFDGVYQVRSDYGEGKNEIRLRLRPEARTAGLTLYDLAKQVKAAYYGEEAVRIQRGREDIKVKIRYARDERNLVSSLDRIRIQAPGGHKAPLSSLVDVDFGPGQGRITRINGQRRVTVRAQVDTRVVQAGEVTAELSREFFKDLKHKHPGLHIVLEGDEERQEESLGSLMVGFPLALMGIFLVMSVMFRSYVQPFVILFTIPFGVIGAVAGHVILGHDLSLMSIFGMVAMTGVAVNDAIVLLERINKNMAEGMDFLEAVENGGLRRFRAVFLTSISTVGGLAPLIMETNQHAQILIPMAVSLAAGLVFATFLTLLLIPSLLVIVNDLRLFFHWIRHGIHSTREAVEPNRLRGAVC